MAKLTLTDILSGFASVAQLNANFDALTTELQDKILYRDNPVGEPNSMQNDIDLNSNDLLNVGLISTAGLTLGGTPVTATTLPQAQLVIDTVANMITSDLISAGMIVQTVDYYSTQRSGGAFYLVKTTGQATSDGDAIDGLRNHTSTGVSGLVLILQLINGVADVKQFGAVGDGVTDDMPSFRQAAETSNYIFVPKVDTFYLVDNSVNFIDLRDNTTLTGFGTIKRTDDARPIVECIGTLTQKKSNVHIHGLSWLADSSIEFGVTTGDSTNGVFRVAYIDNFTFKDNVCQNIIFGGVHVDSANSNVNFMIQVPLDQPSVTDLNNSSHIEISGNTARDDSVFDRPSVTGNPTCLVITFTQQFIVSNNTISGFKSGIYILGAKLNNGVDFTDNSIFKSYRGIISNNTVDSFNVGIWTWGARDILVESNIISNCISESFDTEASLRITFRGNKIIEAAGQCLNMFYDNSDIVFENNNCTVDLSNNAGDVFINSLHETNPALTNFGDVIIRGNTFEAVNPIGTRSIATVQATGMSSFIFENNLCKNIAIIGFGGHDNLDINNNTFINDTAILFPTTVNGIVILTNVIRSNSSARINFANVMDNKFIALGTAINTKPAVYITKSTNDMTINIKRNIVSGHQYIFNIPASACVSQAAGAFRMVINTIDNVIDQAQSQVSLIQDNTNALTDATLVHIWMNNVNENGVDCYTGGAFGAIPNAANYNMYFSIGSKVSSVPPVAGGTEGYVCVTSGHITNAVFKLYGVIAV
jgi:hypothetical protein